MRRRPAKFPPINLLAAVAFDRTRLRSVGDFRALPPPDQARWLEWLVAQEIARRAARRGIPTPGLLRFWSAGDHEIDYVVRPDLLVEGKRGSSSPLEFSWFPRTFPRSRLLIACRDPFQADQIRGLTLEDLLLSPDWQASSPPHPSAPSPLPFPPPRATLLLASSARSSAG